jgi:hypothetical protein
MSANVSDELRLAGHSPWNHKVRTVVTEARLGLSTVVTFIVLFWILGIAYQAGPVLFVGVIHFDLLGHLQGYSRSGTCQS